MVGRGVQRGGGRFVQIARGEGVTGGDVGEPDKGVHQGELPRVCLLFLKLFECSTRS